MFIYSLIHFLFIHLFNGYYHSFIHWLSTTTATFIHAFIHSFIYNLSYCSTYPPWLSATTPRGPLTLLTMVLQVPALKFRTLIAFPTGYGTNRLPVECSTARPYDSMPAIKMVRIYIEHLLLSLKKNTIYDWLTTAMHEIYDKLVFNLL